MPNYRAAARAAARRYGIDPEIFERQINQESGFAEDVITGRRRSSAGALGIAQIMPATAEGWGVDPLNWRAALNASARNMAKYIKAYGGWENALRAYNAGPGAIDASRQYDETNNYVRAILQGATPRDNPRVQGAPNNATPRAPVETGASRLFQTLQKLNEGYLDPQDPIDAGLQRGWDLLAQLSSGSNQPSQPAMGPGLVPRGPKGGGGKLRGSPSDIFELFYDPVGQWDSGRWSNTPIGGHQHVHVAARNALLRKIANRASNRGMSVREFAPYDPVDRVHTEGSFHYGGQAADISGTDAQERWLVKMLRRRYGLR